MFSVSVIYVALYVCMRNYMTFDIGFFHEIIMKSNGETKYTKYFIIKRNEFKIVKENYMKELKFNILKLRLARIYKAAYDTILF